MKLTLAIAAVLAAIIYERAAEPLGGHPFGEQSLQIMLLSALMILGLIAWDRYDDWTRSRGL